MNNLKVIKSFILSFLLILSSALFWKGLADIYLAHNLSASSFIWFGVNLILLVIFFLFFSLLVDERLIFLVIYPLSLLSFFIFFPINFYSLIGLIVLFGAMILSRILMQKERRERLNISVRAVFKNGLPWLMTILALFIGFLGYFYPLTPIDKNEINIPPEILNIFVKPLTNMLGKTLPMLDEKTTIDQALAMNVATQNIDLVLVSPELLAQLKGKNIKDLSPGELLKDPEIAKILKKQSEKINTPTIEEQRRDLAKTLGLDLIGNETMSDVINKIVNVKIKDIFGPTIIILPVISAVLTFITLRIVFIPLGWLVIFLALLIFHFLRAFKFVKIEKVMKQGEDVSI